MACAMAQGPDQRTRHLRFSQWAERRKEEDKFVLINHVLQSTSKGVKYRLSPSYSDTCQKVAKFGATVAGRRYDENWIQVGDYFLPLVIDGKPILIQIHEDDAPEDDPDRAKVLRTEVHPILADRMQREYLWEASKAEFRKQRMAEFVVRNSKVTGSNQEDDGQNVRERLPMPTPGSGAIFTVVADQVEIEGASFEDSPNAPTKRHFHRGEEVELFGWDCDNRRRQFYHEMDGGEAMTGWVRLDLYGPLLRPANFSERITRLDPLCCALYENDTEKLKELMSDHGFRVDFKDETGHTALMNACRWRSVDCVVLLLKGGASLDAVSVGDGRTAADLATADTRAMMEALSGADVFSATGLDASLQELTPQMCRAAEAMLDDIAHSNMRRRHKDDAARALEVERKQASEREHLSKTIHQMPEEDLQKEFVHMQAKMELMKAQLEAKQKETTVNMRESRAGMPDLKASVECHDMFDMDSPRHPEAEEGGDLYRVMFANTRMRSAPSADAAVVGMRGRGDLVRLLEADITGQWRRVEAGTDPSVEELAGSAWMLLRHPLRGALLEPMGDGCAEEEVDDGVG